MGSSRNASSIRVLERSYDSGTPHWQDFVQAIVTGGKYRGVAELLSKILKVPVFIEDKFFRVMWSTLDREWESAVPEDSVVSHSNGSYHKPQYDDPQIASYVALARKTKRPIEMPELPTYGIRAGRIVFPVALSEKEDVEAYLHVFKTDLTPFEMETVCSALRALLVGVIAEREKQKLAEEIRRQMLLQLFAENAAQRRQHFIEEGRLVGFDVTMPSWVVVVEARPVPERSADVVLALESVLSDKSIRASVVPMQGSAILILQEQVVLGQLGSIHWDVQQCLERIYAALSKALPDLDIRMGIGRRCCRMRDFGLAFGEAKKAMASHRSNSHAKGHGGIANYYPLNLVSLLAQPGYETSLIDFAKSLLGPLDGSSQKNSTDLIGTVSCFVENKYCLQTTAGKLYVHPNTLRYRLGKVAKITGLDFQRPDDRLQVELALKIYDYYKDDLCPS
ncbi:MAG: hypothetical protein EPO21_21365 [Chloroflexota bacterium]|nr:MAG: hypothetical protein EPO21_21365 [Chloroflexota bacterium]